MLAFELAVFERLNVDISHYDSFSVAYVSKIINAYRKKKNEVFSQPTEEKALPILPPAQMSKDEMKTELESYRDKKLGLEILPVYLYDYMNELGHQVEINQDILWRACMIRKNFLYCQVENDLERKKEYGQFNRMLENGEIIGAEKLIIHNLAKRIIIFDFLNDKKNRFKS